MSTSDNVIQIKDFLKEGIKASNKEVTSLGADVESISKLRKAMITEERRRVKRTLLTEFISASMVVPGSGLVKVALNDISRGGIAFDILEKYGKFKKGEKTVVRVYLNHTTYFPLSATITNTRFIKKGRIYRHGAKFLEGTLNQEAIHYFISFMETVSTSLKTDLGDIMLSK